MRRKTIDNEILANRSYSRLCVSAVAAGFLFLSPPTKSIAGQSDVTLSVDSVKILNDGSTYNIRLSDPESPSFVVASAAPYAPHQEPSPDTIRDANTTISDASITLNVEALFDGDVARTRDEYAARIRGPLGLLFESGKFRFLGIREVHAHRQ